MTTSRTAPAAAPPGRARGRPAPAAHGTADVEVIDRNLRVLRHAGLIREVGAAQPNEDARARTYQLDAEPIAALHDWLGDVRAFWGTQLQSFKAQAERVARERRGER